MKKKLSSLYCNFVPHKPFASDFFIFEKTFAFYEKFLFSEEKAFAIFRFTIFEGRNFSENGQKSRKFLPTKVSAPKVVSALNRLSEPILNMVSRRKRFHKINCRFHNRFCNSVVISLKSYRIHI